MEPQDPNVEPSPPRVAESGYRVVEVLPAAGPLPVLRLHPALTLLRGFAPGDQPASVLADLLGREGAATCVVEVEGTPMPLARPPVGVVLLTMARLAAFGRGPGSSPEQAHRRTELRDERDYFERRIAALNERLKDYALERDAVTAQFGAAEDLDALANELAGALEVLFAMPEEAWPLDPVAEELAREWASLAGERLRRGLDKIPPPDQAEQELADARAELERLRGDGRLRSADVDRIQELHARVGEAEQAAANAKRAKREELETLADAARAAERDALAVFGMESYSAFLIEMGRIGVRPEFEAEMRAAERAVVAAELRLERSHMLASDRTALEAQERALRARAAASLGIDFDGDLAQVLRGKRLMPADVQAAHETLSAKLPIALRVDPSLTEKVPTEGGNEAMAEAWLNALAQAPSRGADRHDEELRRHQIRLSAQEDACRDELAYLESGLVKVIEEFDALLEAAGQDLASTPAELWEAAPALAAFEAFRREEMPPRSMLVVDDVLGGLSIATAAALFDALVRVTAVHQVVLVSDTAEVIGQVGSLGDRAGSWTPDDARRLEHQRAEEAAAAEARAAAEAAELARAEAAAAAATAAAEAEALARREAEDAAGHANAAAAAARAAAQAQEQAKVEAAAAAARVEEAVTAAQAAAACEERARVEAATAAAQAAAAATAAQVAADAVRHARAEVAAAEARAAVHESMLRQLQTQRADLVAPLAGPPPAEMSGAFAFGSPVSPDSPAVPAPAQARTPSDWSSAPAAPTVPTAQMAPSFERTTVDAPAGRAPSEGAPSQGAPPADAPVPQWAVPVVGTPIVGTPVVAAVDATSADAVPADAALADAAPAPADSFPQVPFVLLAPASFAASAPAAQAPSYQEPTADAPRSIEATDEQAPWPRPERPVLDDDEIRPPGWSLAETLAIYRSGPEAPLSAPAQASAQLPAPPMPTQPEWAPDPLAQPMPERLAEPMPEPMPGWPAEPMPEPMPEPMGLRAPESPAESAWADPRAFEAAPGPADEPAWMRAPGAAPMVDPVALRVPEPPLAPLAPQTLGAGDAGGPAGGAAGGAATAGVDAPDVPEHIYDQRSDDAARATAQRIAALLDDDAWGAPPEPGFGPPAAGPGAGAGPLGIEAPAPWSWDPAAPADAHTGASPALSDGPRLWSPDPDEVRTDLLGAPWNPPAGAALELAVGAMGAGPSRSGEPTGTGLAEPDASESSDGARGGLFGRFRRKSGGRSEQTDTDAMVSGPPEAETMVPVAAASASGICPKHRVETDERCRRCKGSFCNQCLMPVGNKQMCIDCAMVVAGLKRKS